MSKYDPLREFLEKQSRPLIRMSFEQIERIIGEDLPPSARHHRAWWSNNQSNSVMTRAWREAGFKSERVDMKERHWCFGASIGRSPTKGVWLLRKDRCRVGTP